MNILPEPIAERLKAGEAVIADAHENVTILFADLVGFTALSESMSPSELVRFLDGIYAVFDDLADELGVEKIKTMGDGYLVVGGLRSADDARHAARRIAKMALGMRDRTHAVAERAGIDVDVRIGLHTGPVVAGVIGKRKFAYDIWGDAVNVASRMESNGLPGEIQLSDTTRALLLDDFEISRRGEIDIKGKGLMMAWLLNEK